MVPYLFVHQDWKKLRNTAVMSLDYTNVLGLHIWFDYVMEQLVGPFTDLRFMRPFIDTTGRLYNNHSKVKPGINPVHIPNSAVVNSSTAKKLIEEGLVVNPLLYSTFMGDMRGAKCDLDTQPQTWVDYYGSQSEAFHEAIQNYVGDTPEALEPEEPPTKSTPAPLALVEEIVEDQVSPAAAKRTGKTTKKQPRARRSPRIRADRKKDDEEDSTEELEEESLPNPMRKAELFKRVWELALAAARKQAKMPCHKGQQPGEYFQLPSTEVVLPGFNSVFRQLQKITDQGMSGDNAALGVFKLALEKKAVKNGALSKERLKVVYESVDFEADGILDKIAYEVLAQGVKPGMELKSAKAIKQQYLKDYIRLRMNADDFAQIDDAEVFNLKRSEVSTRWSVSPALDICLTTSVIKIQPRRRTVCSTLT